MNNKIVKNKIDHRTKTLDYDSLMAFLASYDSDIISDLIEHSHSEILYFALLGYESYKKLGDKDA